MIEETPFYDAARSALAASTDLAALVGTRIYYEIAPRTAPTPFVVIGLGRLDPTYETDIDQAEGTITFKAVIDADAQGWSKLVQIVAAMARAVDGPLPDTAGWTFDLYWQEARFSYNEPIENRIYGHGGFNYRFNATKQTEV